MEGQPASGGAEDVNEQTMMASGEQSIKERQTASGGAGADNVNEQTGEQNTRQGQTTSGGVGAGNANEQTDDEDWRAEHHGGTDSQG